MANHNNNCFFVNVNLTWSLFSWLLLHLLPSSVNGSKFGGSKNKNIQGSRECDSCPFDFQGALESLKWMLIVLIAVLTPMLIVLVVVFILRICCPKYIRRNSRQETVKSSTNPPRRPPSSGLNDVPPSFIVTTADPIYEDGFVRYQ